MSISILKLGTTGIKDSFKWYVREHSGEIAIIGIMAVIGIGIALLATGDISEAIARGRR
jgi:presenilin-like A22 family membrane protease